MNKFFYLPVLLASMLLIVGCSGSQQASLGKEFSLSPGQSAAITGENLRIKFDKVTEDSRCPKGAT